MDFARLHDLWLCLHQQLRTIQGDIPNPGSSPGWQLEPNVIPREIGNLPISPTIAKHALPKSTTETGNKGLGNQAVKIGSQMSVISLNEILAKACVRLHRRHFGIPTTNPYTQQGSRIAPTFTMKG
jgi:hypothetical protein